MYDDILRRRPKKHMRDLNIVPILDMLTTVIFFLLMSTSFIEYTKLTLPPAKSEASTAKPGSVPVAPKLWVTAGANHDYKLHLMWEGAKPGSEKLEVTQADLVPKLKELLKKFAGDYPTEKTLQVSLDKLVKYQILISVMDGARDIVPDVILLSYTEVNRT
jgi:biopolymer transport protein ExbD